MSCCSPFQSQEIKPVQATSYNFQTNCQASNHTAQVIFAKILPPLEYAIIISDSQEDFMQAANVLYDPKLGFRILSSENFYKANVSIPTEGGFFQTLHIESFSGITTRVNWTFTALSETSVRGQMCLTTGLAGPLPIGGGSVSANCPSIVGMAYPSPDGKEVCFLEYKVSIPGDCFAVEKSYKQYCLNLTDVLSGEGCTFDQKVLDLQVRYPNITMDSLVSYASLRLILSQIVFGNFNLQYLGQCYYPKLIRKLQKSAFCNFAQRLEQDYAGYEWFFQKC